MSTGKRIDLTHKAARRGPHKGRDRPHPGGESQWADEKAFAWCAERGLSDKHVASLAALLREVADAARQEERERLAKEIEAEAKLVPPGDSWWGGPLHSASVYNVMMWAARRIRGEKLTGFHEGGGAGGPMSVSNDWASELARLVAERYCLRAEVETEAAFVLGMIEQVCPFQRGVVYVEAEPRLCACGRSLVPALRCGVCDNDE